MSLNRLFYYFRCYYGYQPCILENEYGYDNECFHVMSCLLYWCPKTQVKWWPCRHASTSPLGVEHFGYVKYCSN